MENERLGVLVVLVLTFFVVAVGAGYFLDGGTKAPEEPSKNNDRNAVGEHEGASADDEPGSGLSEYGSSSGDSEAEQNNGGVSGNRSTGGEPTPSYKNLSGSEYPTDERYVNVYETGEPSDWIPEENFSIQEYRSSTYEVTRYPDAEPTKEHLDAAWNLYSRSYESAERNGWFDFDNGVADGYEQLSVGNAHYINPEYYTDEKDLQPGMPESLVYYDLPRTDNKKVLAGYMYIAEDLDSEGDQVAGPLTVWHYHPASRFGKEILGSILKEEHMRRSDDFSGGMMKGNRSPEMIHVWFIRHPDGPFATEMSVPQENIQEPSKMSEKEFKRYLTETVGTGNED